MKVPYEIKTPELAEAAKRLGDAIDGLMAGTVTPKEAKATVTDANKVIKEVKANLMQRIGARLRS